MTCETTEVERVAEIMKREGDNINREFVAILRKYDIPVQSAHYSYDWRCRVDGATVPCSLLSWVFNDPGV